MDKSPEGQEHTSSAAASMSGSCAVSETALASQLLPSRRFSAAPAAAVSPFHRSHTGLSGSAAMAAICSQAGPPQKGKAKHTPQYLTSSHLPIRVAILGHSRPGAFCNGVISTGDGMLHNVQREVTCAAAGSMPKASMIRHQAMSWLPMCRAWGLSLM